MTNENGTPRKTVTYRASLPLNSVDWTLDLIRQFVRDADSQGIPGDTHLKRFPEHNDWAFQVDNRYYGLGVERVVVLDTETSCPYTECVSHPRSTTS